MPSEADSSSRPCASSRNSNQDTASGKTFREYSPATVDAFRRRMSYSLVDGEVMKTLVSGPRSTPFGNVGVLKSDGRLSTAVGTEYRSGAVASSLSEILEENVPRKYWLSPTSCRGILLRAEKRGKKLPEHLARALRAVADSDPPSSAKADSRPK